GLKVWGGRPLWESSVVKTRAIKPRDSGGSHGWSAVVTVICPAGCSSTPVRGSALAVASRVREPTSRTSSDFPPITPDRWLDLRASGLHGRLRPLLLTQNAARLPGLTEWRPAAGRRGLLPRLRR